MTFAKTSLLAVAALAGGVSLCAAAGQSSSQGAALQQAEQNVDALASSTKGGPQQRLLLEKQRLHQLTDDIDAGRSVDPAEIDRALQRAENPGLY